MKDRFTKLLMRQGANPDSVQHIWNIVCSAYLQPRRHYHNMLHIAKCLDHLDRIFDRGYDMTPAIRFWHDAVELALWFHDVNYYPGRTDNEATSANTALGCLLECDVNWELCEAVINAIRATTHDKTVEVMISRIVCDIDLMRFAETPAVFYADNCNIWNEYHEVATFSQYKAGSAALFKRMLARPRIYQTDHFHGLYEAAARANLTAYLKSTGMM